MYATTTSVTVAVCLASGESAAVLHPLGDLATIRLTAGGGAVLAEIDVFAVDRDDGLTGGLVESIARSTLGRTEIRHGATLSDSQKR